MIVMVFCLAWAVGLMKGCFLFFSFSHTAKSGILTAHATSNAVSAEKSPTFGESADPCAREAHVALQHSLPLTTLVAPNALIDVCERGTL